MDTEQNVWELKGFKEGSPSQEITFYKMLEDGSSIDGTTLEEMLRVCNERLTMFQESFPCNENAQALNGITTAIQALEARTADRKAREVEGKHAL